MSTVAGASVDTDPDHFAKRYNSKKKKKNRNTENTE